jgi:hypothetical protein
VQYVAGIWSGDILNGSFLEAKDFFEPGVLNGSFLEAKVFFKPGAVWPSSIGGRRITEPLLPSTLFLVGHHSTAPPSASPLLKEID